MNKYGIGTRLYGYSKDYLKALTCEISKKFNLNEDQRVAPPHLTFLRPFYTKDENELVGRFNDFLHGFNEEVITYALNGFGIFENKEKVFYGAVRKNSQIEKIIYGLEVVLEDNIEFVSPRICLPDEDRINLHCAIVSNGINGFYSEIRNFLENQDFAEITHPLLRVYLLKNKMILREFDFYLNESLGRWDAKNPFVYRETQKAFERKTGHFINRDGIMLPLPRTFP